MNMLTPVMKAADHAVDMVHIDILNSSIVALLGYFIVFVGIIFLMAVIVIIGKVFIAKENKQKAAEPVAEAAPAVDAPAPTAPGAAGNLKLYNVEPKTAAMIMAIVADKMGKPLNELRFLSIKEVE